MDDISAYEILKDTLAPEGATYETEYTVHYLRDTFPKGVPVDLAIKAVKEANRGDESLENFALVWLAMVPTPGISDEVVSRLNRLRYQGNQTEYVLSERYRLSKALRFSGLKEGENEFNELKKLMESYPKYRQPIPATYFEEFEELLAEWKKDRAEGKHWEPEE